jgi:hypothetical protein
MDNNVECLHTEIYASEYALTIKAKEDSNLKDRGYDEELLSQYIWREGDWNRPDWGSTIGFILVCQILELKYQIYFIMTLSMQRI